MNKITFGITTFLESGVDADSGQISHFERINHAIEEIVKADEVGIDFYGIGEHHRSDYAATNPEMILASAAKLTKNIMLGSSVTVLSSEDPIRVYEAFSTLDNLSKGRAHIMAGRGSFIESFPLFGYDLEDYDDLFTEKLNQLIHINQHEVSHWKKTKHTVALNDITIYPRSYRKELSMSIAVGGSQQSVVRAAKLGLPMILAIIGGDPIRFKPFVDLYKYFYIASGHDESKMEIGVHAHGLITDQDESEFFERYFKSHHAYFKKIGSERGWSETTKSMYYHNIEHGPLFIGNAKRVTDKIERVMKSLGINKFLLHAPGAYMPHEDVMKSLELYGLEVIPKLKERLS